MVKRKADESAFEFRQRKKRYKYKKDHQYDDEQNYWKNASKQATRQARSGIQSLFEGAGLAGGLAAAGSGVVRAGAAVNSILESVYMPAIVEAVGTDALGVAMAGAGTLTSGAIPLVAGAGVLAGQAIGSLFTQNTESLAASIMPGTYQGKFAMSAQKQFKGLRDKYQKKGGVYIIENFGTVSDPDLVYIGHSTFNRGCVAYSICYALLRKLFRVGLNLDVASPYEELPLINTTPDSGPNGFEIIYRTRDSDGNVLDYVYTIANDQSLHTLSITASGGFSLFDNITDSMTLSNPRCIEKVFLYEKGGAELRLVYQMDMAKEVVSLAMSSHMVIQNRTKSGQDGSPSTTNVDVQPLKGPVFEFSVGVPKIKADTPLPLNQIGDSGCILVRAGQFGGTDTTAYREPPTKKLFQNVVKSGYTRLNPGALKSMTIGCDMRGYFTNLFQRLSFNYENTQLKRAFGKSQLVAFEEEMNSGSAYLITVSYECQHIAGCEFTTTYSPNLQPGYDAGQINNNPA